MHDDKGVRWPRTGGLRRVVAPVGNDPLAVGTLLLTSSVSTSRGAPIGAATLKKGALCGAIEFAIERNASHGLAPETTPNAGLLVP